MLQLTTRRQEFQAQVPGWFPVDENLTVLGSWALYGGGWLRRRTRRG